MAGIMDTEFILQCYHNIRIGGLPCVLPKGCALTAMLAEWLERPHAHYFAYFVRDFVPQNSWLQPRTYQAVQLTECRFTSIHFPRRLPSIDHPNQLRR